VKTIYVVRHAENHANITKEFSHRHVDYSLTGKGRVQARQTADYLSGAPIDHVFASPLKRALETARPIADDRGLPVTIIEELREVNVGRLEVEGDLRENWVVHNRIVMGWFTGEPEVRLPDGENLPELRARTRRAFKQILAATREVAVVVTHGGVLAFGVPPLVEAGGLNLLVEQHNCAISTLVFDNGFPGRVASWANWDHLNGHAAEVVSGMLRPEQ
jgi:probable phosphoglycerate mutase